MQCKRWGAMTAPLLVAVLCGSVLAAPRTVEVKVTVNSQSPGTEAVRALDGSRDTFWRTDWSWKHTRHAHEILLDLGESFEIEGFVYTPIRGGGNGNIKDYEFYVSDDERNMGQPLLKGAFDENDSDKRIVLEEKTSGRYVKLRALSAVNRQPWTSIAELQILSEGMQFRAAKPSAEETAQLDEQARRGHRPPGNSIDDVLDLTLRTLAMIERARPQPKLAAELRALEKRFGQGDNSGALTEELRKLRRRIVLTHPALNFDKLLINKRPPPGYSHMCDQYLGRHSRPGPGLTVLQSWKDNPRVRVLLSGKLPEGSMLHPDLSFDGRRILFSFCDHTIQDTKARRFLVYETDVDGNWVRQLTGTPDDPMTGWEGRSTVLVEDFDPCYLPDGGFAMISTRSQTFGRCHGSRYVPTYMLFRADGDGSNIHQLSFGEANEWDPSVMHNGRLVYTRWDYINRHDTRFQSLWAMAPDGTSTTHFYGNYSESPCMTAEARAVPGSHQVLCTATAHHGYTNGTAILIDPHKGQDGEVPVSRVTPEIRYPEASDRVGGGGSGTFATPWPLCEDLYLIAYTGDNATGQGGVQAANAYAIYLVDVQGGRELIYRDPNMSCFAPIPVRSRPRPPVLASNVADKEDQATGVFYVQQVHRGMQPTEPGTIKRLRINRIYGQPNNGKPQLSLSNNEIIKGIVGTVPVDRNGSVAFRAPAGMPLQLQALDENGMAVMTMRSVVYLQPGEVASCVGCHESRGSTPGPVAIPRNMRIHDPTPPAGPQYAGGFSFMRTVQPVLDRYCIECHGLRRTDAGVNLLGTDENGYNTAHNTLTKLKDFVKIAYRNQETGYSEPKDYFAHAGRLAKYLMEDHRNRVRLDAESLQRIIDWLDLNAQYYGDYSQNRVERRRISGDGEKALREYIEQRFGAEVAKQPIVALVNIAMPEESRILKAPVATRAGGWEQLGQGRFNSTGDPEYRTLQELVDACVSQNDSFDIAGTCGRDRCGCGTCWTRHLREARLYPVVDLGLEPFPRNPPGQNETVDIAKDGWRLVRATSEETTATDGRAIHAFDDDRATCWHTQCTPGPSAPPHEIVIDLGKSHDVVGFRLLPRGGVGDVKDCRFYVSDDPEKFGSPAAEGTFTDRRAEQAILFEARRGRYVLVQALSEFDGSPYTSIRELSVLEAREM
ncbi:MAG: discoidin domain-containing protein [Candidatus Nealsonbacteria bacterium]|nr:discoidin domain-containing protein [Candidatus Nealsonbacteria bacterium]